MGTESGDDPVAGDVAARTLAKRLWAKCGLDPFCQADDDTGTVRVQMTPAEATVLAEYLAESERRPF